ncbi:MAG: type II toxin-antitoxin system Phd/YefM family antitoxin [Acidimicrobiales bacterium]
MGLAPTDPDEGLPTIGVRELRAGVASFVQRAANGERLVITVDGRPMAQLGPLTPTGAPQLADLAAAGLIEPPRSPPPSLAPEPEDLPVDVRLERVIEDLRGR